MDLQLRSAAGVVLAVGCQGCWMDAQGRAEALLQRALLVLWGRHQSFRGLLLAEVEAGVWGGLLLDPFAHRDTARGVQRAFRHNQSAEYAHWYTQRFYRAMVTGEVDFAPVHVGASGDLPLDTLGASHVIEKTVMLVPHAQPLPSWSLPLRVFGPAIWGALLGAAAVYALA